MNLTVHVGEFAYSSTIHGNAQQPVIVELAFAMIPPPLRKCCRCATRDDLHQTFMMANHNDGWVLHAFFYCTKNMACGTAARTQLDALRIKVLESSPTCRVHCTLCQKPPVAQLLLCPACGIVGYCSDTCRDKDMADHRKECRTIKEQPVDF